MSSKCKIKIHGCDNLPLIDGKDIDPYAIIVGDCTRKTLIGKTKAGKKTQHPEWNESFEFEYFLASKILIYVIDKRFGFDKDIGKAVVDLSKVCSSDKFPVPLKPLVGEKFTGNIFVSIKFGFPAPEEVPYKRKYKTLYATLSFDHPLQVPPEAPSPVILKCLVYNEVNKSFIVYDDKSNGFYAVLSSGNKKVFTGNGFSQVFMFNLDLLKRHTILFLVQSVNYDGIVTLNLGLKKFSQYMSYCGYGTQFFPEGFKVLKTVNMEIGSQQYITAPFSLAFRGVFTKCKIHDNSITMLKPGEDYFSFEYSAACNLIGDNKILRKNIISSFSPSFLFPYLLPRTDKIKIVFPIHYRFFIPVLYVFDEAGQCVYEDKNITKKDDDPIYKYERMISFYPFEQSLGDITIASWTGFGIDLARFSIPGTKIVIAGSAQMVRNRKNNSRPVLDDELFNYYFLFMDRKEKYIAYGRCPIDCKNAPNHASYPVIFDFPSYVAFSLSFLNNEWVYTPINKRIGDTNKNADRKSVV